MVSECCSLGGSFVVACEDRSISQKVSYCHFASLFRYGGSVLGFLVLGFGDLSAGLNRS